MSFPSLFFHSLINIFRRNKIILWYGTYQWKVGLLVAHKIPSCCWVLSLTFSLVQMNNKPCQPPSHHYWFCTCWIIKLPSCACFHPLMGKFLRQPLQNRYAILFIVFPDFTSSIKEGQNEHKTTFQRNSLWNIIQKDEEYSRMCWKLSNTF